MKKAALLVAGLFFVLNAAAQEPRTTIAGNGKIITQKRDVSDFTKLNVSGPFEVCLTHGNTGKVILEGDENVLELITTEITNGTLSIVTQNGQPVKASIGHKIKIKLPYNTIDLIALTGCGTIKARGIVRSPKLKATVDGPGNITLSIVSNEVTAWILGSGSIDIEGTAAVFNCKVVGSGSVKAEELNAEQVIAGISGSGDVKVKSEKTLTGRIVGTGNIAFAGEPTEIDLKHLGTGSFTRD